MSFWDNGTDFYITEVFFFTKVSDYNILKFSYEFTWDRMFVGHFRNRSFKLSEAKSHFTWNCQVKLRWQNRHNID
jgi:hypothetical protein